MEQSRGEIADTELVRFPPLTVPPALATSDHQGRRTLPRSRLRPSSTRRCSWRQPLRWQQMRPTGLMLDIGRKAVGVTGDQSDRCYVSGQRAATVKPMPGFPEVIGVRHRAGQNPGRSHPAAARRPPRPAVPDRHPSHAPALARRAGQAPLDLPAPGTRPTATGPAIRRLVLEMARERPRGRR